MKPSMPLELSCRASLLLFLLEYSILSNLLKPGILPRKGASLMGEKQDLEELQNWLYLHH